jgi:hypothetical protein
MKVTSPPGSPNDSPYDIIVSTTAGASAASSADQFTYTADPVAGKISVRASNLSIRKGDELTITGTGWTPGLLVIITICTADASNISPLVQLSQFDFTPDACAPITIALSPHGNFVRTTLKGPDAGAFTWTGTLIPGQLDPAVGSPLAECPQDQTQGAEGVNCIVGAAELIGLSADGNTADAPVFFAPPALSHSETYQSGLGASAEYDVTLSDTGAFAESGDPPVATASGIPNNGGFGTNGVICSAGTGPGSSPPVPCSPELAPPAQNAKGVWSVSPVACQAASSSGGTAWASLPVCTFGEGAGEPIKIELLSYKAPNGTTLTKPFPTDTPLDCSGGITAADPFECSVVANAGSGISDPGGFSSDVTNAATGQSPPAALMNLQPGTYTFAAIGGVSGNKAVTTFTLPMGPTS